MKKITSILTLDNFAFYAGCGTYALRTNEGEVTIEMTKKQSNFGKGELTVYDCTIVSVDGTKTEYKEKPIGYYKKLFGATVNHREGTVVSSAKVLTNDEITNAVLTWEGKILAMSERLQKLTIDGYDLLIVPCNKETKELLTLPDFSAKVREAIVANNEKAIAEREKAEKLNAERKEKAEKRELAKSVASLNDVQTELMKAVVAGDFAKVAELTAKLQTA